jgi:hypothetical protein
VKLPDGDRLVMGDSELLKALSRTILRTVPAEIIHHSTSFVMVGLVWQVHSVTMASVALDAFRSSLLGVVGMLVRLDGRASRTLTTNSLALKQNP